MQRCTERLYLLQESVRQLLSRNDRQSWDVVDGLLGVELCTLTAGLVENVDDMCLDVDKTQLEHRKQANRASTYNHDVGFDRISPVG